MWLGWVGEGGRRAASRLFPHPHGAHVDRKATTTDGFSLVKPSLLTIWFALRRCTLECEKRCSLSQWSAWSACQPDSCLGQQAGPVLGKKPVSALECEKRCSLSQWSAWSACQPDSCLGKQTGPFLGKKPVSVLEWAPLPAGSTHLNLSQSSA